MKYPEYKKAFLDTARVETLAQDEGVKRAYNIPTLKNTVKVKQDTLEQRQELYAEDIQVWMLRRALRRTCNR